MKAYGGSEYIDPRMTFVPSVLSVLLGHAQTERWYDTSDFHMLQYMTPCQ
jgi:hypothetical protein